MNELQVRLTADITALQSALTRAKKTIQSFESDTNKESEKGNVGFRRKIGLIEQLTNKAKNLRTALSQATNETQIAKYNAQLEDTTREMARLNALGRSVRSNLNSTAGGFGKVAFEGRSANGVAQEFTRIIQDAPFGIIGIGNNLQQLATNFGAVTAEAKRTGGTVGTALKASLNSLISPVNLGILAFSALTAGFTAYQMGAFDGIFATEDLGKAAEEAAQKLEDYRAGLDAVTRATIEGRSQAEKEVQTFGLLRAQAENANIPLQDRVEAVRDLQQQYPDYLGNLTQEQILTGNVGDAYQNLTQQIIATAKARAASDAIAENSLDLLTREQQELTRVSQIIDLQEQKRAIQEASQNAIAQSREEELQVATRISAIDSQINDLIQEQVDSANARVETQRENARLEEEINNQISQGARFTENNVKAVKELNEAFDENIAKVKFINELQSGSTKAFESLASGLSSGLKSELQILENKLSQALAGGSSDEVERLQAKITNVKAVLSNFAKDVKDIPIKIDFIPEGGKQELGLIQQLQQQIQSINELRDVATDPSRIQNYNAQLQALQQQLAKFTQIQSPIEEQNKVLLDSFSALGIGIASSLNISNNAFKGFITTVLSATPKIIQAILAQSAAKKLAAKTDIATNSQVAGSEGIAVASKAANALGPVGLALLPVFIGGALALISGAFNKIGGGGKISGGGGSIGAGSGRPPQIFTNANTVTPPSPNIPSPSGNIDFGNAQGRLEARIDGGDIVFVYDRYKERQAGGG